MAITATLINDVRNGKTTQITRTTRGIQATVWYRVNTSDPYKAVTASGLPALREIWSPDEPELRVTDIGPAEIFGGERGSGTDPGGWSFVPVKYQSPELAAVPYLVSRTKLTINPMSQNVRFGIDTPVPGGANDYNIAIANGDGTTRDVGLVRAEVNRFFTIDDSGLSSYLLQCVDLATRNALNDAAVTLPPIFGTEIALTLQKLQIRYRGFSTQLTNGYCEVIHELLLSTDHRVYWQLQDKDGKPLSGRKGTFIYPSASFAGLFT